MGIVSETKLGVTMLKRRRKERERKKVKDEKGKKKRKRERERKTYASSIHASIKICF